MRRRADCVFIKLGERQRKKKMNILYFAPVYYDDMKQRPQQLAECLARKHQVYYIEPTVSFLRWLLKGGRSFHGRKKKISSSLRVIRLNGCLTIHKSLEIFDICGANNWSELLQLYRLIQTCDVIWTGYTGWYTLVRHIRKKPIVFDKMDEEDLLAPCGCLKMTLKRNKRKMTQLADVIFVTGRQFYEDLQDKKENVYHIPNALSPLPADVSVSFEKVGQIRRFGYIGTMSEWFDTEVIQKILDLDPKYEVILVGRNYLKELRHPRVHYLGVRRHQELAGMIQSFDVCLYNFKQTPVLDTINPVKIYEYLSLNKPVLAVKSKETIQLQNYLMLYTNVDEIQNLLHDKVQRPFSNPAEHKKFLDENSWEARCRRMEQVLDSVWESSTTKTR